MNTDLHPWKQPLNRPGRPIDNAERGEVDCLILSEAFKRSGLSKGELARRMGWLKKKADVHRVSQVLGMEKDSAGNLRRRVTYRTAVRLCKAMNASPIELGI
jgi:hypothetical protein